MLAFLVVLDDPQPGLRPERENGTVIQASAYPASDSRFEEVLIIERHALFRVGADKLFAFLPDHLARRQNHAHSSRFCLCVAVLNRQAECAGNQQK